MNRIPPQLEATASQLNSNDAFLLVTPGGSFLWVGVGASDTERQGAQQLADILGVSPSQLSEGGEMGEERSRRPRARSRSLTAVKPHTSGFTVRLSFFLFSVLVQCSWIFKQGRWACISLSDACGNLLI